MCGWVVGACPFQLGCPLPVTEVEAPAPGPHRSLLSWAVALTGIPQNRVEIIIGIEARIVSVQLGVDGRTVGVPCSPGAWLQGRGEL